jgi:hypothetical protein
VFAILAAAALLVDGIELGALVTILAGLSMRYPQE